MKRVLVVPAAGLSSRYGLGRPKFLLQHPTGGTMLEHAILGLEGLGPELVDEIVVISLEPHFENVDVEKITKRIEQLGVPVRFHFLEKPTSSVVETVSLYLHSLDEDIALTIKDSDNQLSLNLGELETAGFAMAYISLQDFPEVVARNKSFLEIGTGSLITNVIEKKIISEFISVGLTRFAASSDFLRASLQLGSVSSEIYISDIVRVLMSEGVDFKAVPASKYEDWGTLREWLAFVGTFQTLFVDIDGVISENMSPINLKNNWDSISPIIENVSFLLELEQSGRSQLVFTTARSEQHAPTITRALEELGFTQFRLICGLFHAKRVLVNDFAVTNPYPSATSINIPRDSKNLRAYF